MHLIEIMTLYNKANPNTFIQFQVYCLDYKKYLSVGQIVSKLKEGVNNKKKTISCENWFLWIPTSPPPFADISATIRLFLLTPSLRWIRPRGRREEKKKERREGGGRRIE